MKVVIIGSGNVATVLGKKIQLAGHEIVQVAGRNEDTVRELAANLHCEFTFNLLEINILAELLIICVADTAVASVAGELKFNKQIVVHTAAGVSMEVLRSTSDNYGVLYPLQSLRKKSGAVPPIPVLINGANDSTIKKLTDFAADWADTVGFAGDEERVKLHLAAVFTNNFVNHLFTVSQQYCIDNGLEYKHLGRLIEETMLRVKEYPAVQWQTGPAMRNDYNTLARHETMLEGDKDLLQVYKALSNSIMAYHCASSS